MPTRKTHSRRGEITAHEKQFSSDLSKQESDLGDSVNDLEVLQELNRELRREGTHEGEERIDQSLESTKGVAGSIHEGYDRKIVETQEDGAEYGNELDDRAGDDDADLKQIETADSRIKELRSKSELSRTRDATREDMEFLKKEAEQFEQRARDSKRQAENLRQRANAARH